jgi:hypothetical protein
VQQHSRSRSPAVTVVTEARRSHSDDITVRQRRYVAMQSLRMACVLLATLLPVALAWKGLLILGAVALPWFGVVMANAPTVQRRRRNALVDRPGEPIAEQPLRLALDPATVVDGER